ncbi:hypothetical protein RFI_36215 [Reticulomyxa filosa]|uniref:Uncharacterized protein n=1 Tax=Reticulomyxa filosa TaxID=46433 RepID=X6LKG7_RETFI|nr:hypothetical protein RFI_36215 [Reticulomyxa filosa]|eukprot:ETO01225.1 hypothetical protein RFI_36215 [Reticulomyxa filosa]
MDSAMLASGIQPSVRNLVGVVERPSSNSINANNADESKSDEIILQQIDNETMEALIICCKEFSTTEFLYIFFIFMMYTFFFCCFPNEVRDDEKKFEDFKEKSMKSIQLNVVKNLRTWMKLYCEEDFANDEKVGSLDQANANGLEAIFLE